MVCLWARLKREDWDDVPYGAGADVECTDTHDCRCRACRNPLAVLVDKRAMARRRGDCA